MAAASAGDRFLFWPLIMALGIPAIHIVIRATPAGHDLAYVLLGIPMLAIIWGGFGVAAAVMLARSIASSARKRALPWLVVCLVVAAAALRLDTVRRYTNLAGDVLHLAVMYPSYSAAIERIPDNGELKLVVFNFGGMIWASGGVVYDESDEIKKPSGQQSEAWKPRAMTTELGCDGYSYTPLIGHFYLADFPC